MISTLLHFLGIFILGALRVLGAERFARAWCNLCVRLRPGAKAIFLAQLGGFFEGLGKLGTAEDLYRSALADNPDDGFLLLLLGSVLEKRNHPESAIRSYEQGLRLDPGISEKYRRLFESRLSHLRSVEDE